LRGQARITLGTTFQLIDQPPRRCNAMAALFWAVDARSVRKKQLPSAMVNPSRREGKAPGRLERRWWRRPFVDLRRSIE